MTRSGASPARQQTASSNSISELENDRARGSRGENRGSSPLVSTIPTDLLRSLNDLPAFQRNLESGTRASSQVDLTPGDRRRKACRRATAGPTWSRSDYDIGQRAGCTAAISWPSRSMTLHLTVTPHTGGGRQDCCGVSGGRRQDTDRTFELGVAAITQPLGPANFVAWPSRDIDAGYSSSRTSDARCRADLPTTPNVAIKVSMPARGRV
jgi:hypothetical protein